MSTLRAELADLRISILGGTGAQGRGLGRRFAIAGLPVVLGSRDRERAIATAATLAEVGPITGTSNDEAAAAGDIVVIAVPWAAHETLLRECADTLRGKLVVDCVNPLGFDAHGAFALEVAEGSATEQAAALLPESTVVGAFHHISAALLEDPDLDRVESDVLIVGDVREATDLVGDLASVVPGMRGVYGGRLRNAGQVEALTANLISANRRYGAHAGLRLTGCEGADQ